jgi:hypothetical protein
LAETLGEEALLLAGGGMGEYLPRPLNQRSGGGGGGPQYPLINSEATKLS